MKTIEKKCILKQLVCLLLSCSVTLVSFAARHHYHNGYMPYFQAKKQQKTSYYRHGSKNDLWQAITQQFSLPHYTKTPAVKQQIRWFMSHPQALEKMATQSEPYLYYIYQQVKQHHMPGELVLLPMIESAYNPFAYSSVGAAGLWQLMPGTATGFGLRRDYWFDGRKDIISSTRAALTYLKYLRDFFHGNWLLAIASYNSGEGTVLKAVNANRRRGYSTKFWSLRLPRQTQTYVPRLLALAAIISDPKRYPVHFPHFANTPYFGKVKLKKQTSLKKIAKKAHVKLEDIYQLNPGFKHWATDPDKRVPQRILLPIEKVSAYRASLGQSSNKPHKTTGKTQSYKVRSGDTLSSISQHFVVGMDQLMKANHLSKSLIKVNQEIIIPLGKSPSTPATKQQQDKPQKTSPTQPPTKADTKVAKKKTKTPSPHQNNIYRVKAGDSLWSIAQHFKTTVPELQAWNHFQHKSLHPGQRIRIKKSVKNQSPTHHSLSSKQHYRIKKGDSLSRIAKQHHVPLKNLMKINHLTHHSVLKPGQLLILPS